MRISPSNQWNEYYIQCKKLIRQQNWFALQQSFPVVLRLARNIKQHQDFLKMIEPLQSIILNPSNHLIYAELLLPITRRE